MPKLTDDNVIQISKFLINDEFVRYFLHLLTFQTTIIYRHFYK
jgi:hypothetical protein